MRYQFHCKNCILRLYIIHSLLSLASVTNCSVLAQHIMQFRNIKVQIQHNTSESGNSWSLDVDRGKTRYCIASQRPWPFSNVSKFSRPTRSDFNPIIWLKLLSSADFSVFQLTCFICKRVLKYERGGYIMLQDQG